MKLLPAMLVVSAWIFSALPVVNAAPAKFWLSSSNINPIAPEAPTVNAAVNNPNTLYIWAQPATRGTGSFNATTNPFRTLQGFSLNLVTQSALVDFINGTFTVYNPTVDTKMRFENVYDSHNTPSGLTSAATAAQVAAGTPDAIRGESNRGLQGFSLSGSQYLGIGPKSENAADQHCYVGDPYCAEAANGRGPAWLVGSIGFQSVLASGSSGAYLQIGSNGMIHRGDPTTAGTQVTFGIDGPVYDAGNRAHRGVTLPGDDPDVQVLALSKPVGDFNGDGVVGLEDYEQWQSSFGLSVVPGSGADANSDGVIGAADFVMWRDNWVAPLAGDYDGNGSVGPEDFVKWRATFGQEVVAGAGADGNRNRIVDAADYIVWRNSLGQPGPGLAAADNVIWRDNPRGQSGADARATVPEPISALLLILGTASGSWTGRRVASRVPSTR